MQHTKSRWKYENEVRVKPSLQAKRFDPVRNELLKRRLSVDRRVLDDSNLGGQLMVHSQLRFE